MPLDLQFSSLADNSSFNLTEIFLAIQLPPHLIETRTFVATKRYSIERIDDVIDEAANWLRELRANKDMQSKKYYEVVGRRASDNHAQMASELGIELPKPDSEGKYKQIGIEFADYLVSPK